MVSRVVLVEVLEPRRQCTVWCGAVRDRVWLVGWY